MPHSIKISLITEENQTKEYSLSQSDDGFYRIELAWRYILKPGVVLDTILKDSGLEYVRRPPGEFYELWREKAILRSYDHNGNVIHADAS